MSSLLYVLITVSCVPLPSCPMNFRESMQAFASAIRIGCLAVVGVPQVYFCFSMSSPGILEKLKLSDVSFTGEQLPVLHSKAWESFRSVRWLAEMPSSEQEAMLAASTLEISLDVSIWPKRLFFGKHFSLFTAASHLLGGLITIISTKQKLT